MTRKSAKCWQRSCLDVFLAMCRRNNGQTRSSCEGPVSKSSEGRPWLCDQTRNKSCPSVKAGTFLDTVTHKYIHWIQYDVKILVHLMLGHYSWIQGKDMEAAIKVKMKLVQNALRPGAGRIGIAFIMPTNGGSGGNITIAEAARKVYQTPELRERLVALLVQVWLWPNPVQYQPHPPASIQQQRAHGWQVWGSVHCASSRALGHGLNFQTLFTNCHNWLR